MSTDAANIPGIDDTRIKAEPSDFSSLQNSDDSVSMSKTASSSSETIFFCEGGPGDEGSSAQGSTEAIRHLATSGGHQTDLNSAVSQDNAGLVSEQCAASNLEPNKRQRVATSSSDEAVSAPDMERALTMEAIGQPSTAESEAPPEPPGQLEYVYPLYLRQGAGRDLLALTLDMRASCASDRPTWSRVLQRIRAAGQD